MNQELIAKARATYNIEQWSDGYFDINEQGHVIAFPDSARIDFMNLCSKLKDLNINQPVLIRFTDILRLRVQKLQEAFDKAINQANYNGHYTPVYPIKVNQQYQVVKNIVGVNGVGLEAGSKPELMAVLAMAPQFNSVIICNGYKDREYIRMALLGQRLGHKIYLIIEKSSELNLILQQANLLGIKPLLGVRIRLTSLGKGHWQNSGGVKSKFGLTLEQLLKIIADLHAADQLDCLQLLHFHLGSQIANIRDIQNGLTEAARHYVELHRLGVAIKTVDVGGGLGIDYEGSRSRNFHSKNYSLEEYAYTVIRAFSDICHHASLPHPNIITESGRAMTAHHAVLITNIIDVERYSKPETLIPLEENTPTILQDMTACLEHLSARAKPESYHEASFFLSEAHSMYNHGLLTLEQRAQAEQLHSAICFTLKESLNPHIRAHRDILDELDEKLAAKYFCNFSIFQSMPDIWAIKQIFPIMPLARLNETLSEYAILQDLTCDSDGRIDHYVANEGIEPTLPLPPHDDAAPYLIGVFLVGAYQEILGDMHNLSADTQSVNVVLTDKGGYELVEPEPGNSITDVLSSVNFSEDMLLEAYTSQLEQTDLSAAEKVVFLAELKAELAGYTYFED